MNKILFLTILISSFIVIIADNHSGYEFHDTHGRCWRCLSGSDCVRCNEDIFHRRSAPTTWDRTCQLPTTTICSQNPGAKFPHQNIALYYICAFGDRAVTVQCFCDQAFDMREQRCVPVDELRTIACDNYTNMDPTSC
ncbi:uncharacterized protein [Chironomus tepperi]|uniref:uncharacterized protein n=1 Tax=Chironomus tepperi TaxID=113505 RepID=UPI00391F6D3D